MSTTLGDCKLCGMTVSPLSSYVKEGRLFMHLNCYMEPKIKLAKEEGINEKLAAEEQQRTLAREAEAAAAQAESDRQLIEARDAPRCTGCDVRLRKPGTKYLAPLHKGVTSEEAGKEPGKCKRCSPVVYDGPRSGAIPKPAPVAAEVVPITKKPEHTDRFAIIELE